MTLLKRLSLSVLGTTALAFINPAAQAASFIDFENPELRGLSDNSAITDQYSDLGFTFGLDDDLDGIADIGSAPVLEQVGGSDSQSGFVNAGSGNDVAEAGFFDADNDITFAQRLGNYFLRTSGLGGNGGSLLISYIDGTAAASGELWDIDGNENFFPDGSPRTEKWEVQALGNDASVLESLFSPEGTAANGPLDGKPWLWSFQRESADIKAIRFLFRGESPQRNVGLAFDNFSAFSVEGGDPVDIPEPSSLLGLAAFGAVASILSKQYKKQNDQ